MPPPYGAPQFGGPLAGQRHTMAPDTPVRPPLSASTRLLKRLLLIATCVSLVSAASFIAYLVIPHVVSSQRGKHIPWLFVGGLVGLAISELCQFVGVFVLIWQWGWRERTRKKFREIVVLLVALFPYMVIVLFVMTLVVFLRARREDPASRAAQDARDHLKDKATNMIVDEVANTSQSAVAGVANLPRALPPVAPGGRPPRFTMREAVGRVVGPSTQRSLSDAGGGLAGVTMAAVVLATVATLGALSPLSRLTPAKVAAITTPTVTPTATQPAGQITEFKVSTQFGIASMLSGSITTGPDGALWFTDGGASAIGRMTASGQATEWATPTRASEPGETTLGNETHGITTGADGNLWFTEDHNGAGQIGRCTPQGVITEFPVSGSAPTSIVSGPDGALWFTDNSFNNAIGVMTPAGSVKEYPIPTGYSGPSSIVSGPDGALWFLEGTKVGRVTTSGAFTEYPVPPTPGRVYPGILSELTVGPDGNLWLTITSPNSIARITPTGVVTNFPITATGTLGGITKGADGNLWFTEAQAGKIGRITPAGQLLPELSVPSSMSLPLGITTGPDGALWFTETNVTAAIGRIAP